MTGQHGPWPTAAPSLAQGEPVAVAEGVRALLVAAVAAGWVVIPDATINLIVSAAALLGSVATTWWARRRVVPVAKLEE